MSCYSYVAASLAWFIAVDSIAVAQNDTLVGSALNISVDQILLDNQQVKLEFGVDYSASNQQSLKSLYQSFLTQNGRIIDIPVSVTSVEQERQTFVGNLGLRYGLTPDTELSGVVSVLHRNEYGYRHFDSVTSKTSETQFADFSMRLSRQMNGEGGSPKLVGFFEVPVAQNLAQVGTQMGFLKAITVGATVYSPSDPLLLMLTGGYKYRRPRKVDSQRINPGNSIFLSPSVFFAVNNEITLSGGISAQFITKDKIDNVETRSPRTQGDALFGLSFGVNEKVDVNFETKFRVFGEQSFSFGVNLSKKINWK